MEGSDKSYRESDVLPLSLHPVDGLPKEIKVKSQGEIVVMSEGDGVSAWAKARI